MTATIDPKRGRLVRAARRRACRICSAEIPRSTIAAKHGVGSYTCPACVHKEGLRPDAPAQVSPPMNRKKAASFRGRCRACGVEIAAGDVINFAVGYGARCLACGEHPADSTPMPPLEGREAIADEETEPGDPGGDDQIDDNAGEQGDSDDAEPGAGETEQASNGEQADGNSGSGDGDGQGDGKGGADSGTATGGEMPTKSAGDGDDALGVSATLKRGTLRLEYASIGSAIDHAFGSYATDPDNLQRLERNLALALSGDNDFYFNHTKASILAETISPRAEVLQAIDALRSDLAGKIPAPATRRRMRRGLDAGDELDPDRYLDRDPLCWSAMQRTRAGSRHFRIILDITISKYGGKDAMLVRGATAIALSDFLTMAGHNVELVLAICCDEPSPIVSGMFLTIVAKRPTMPLDLAAIAFPACETVFGRLVGFFAGYRHVVGQFKNGYVGQIPAKDRKAFDFVIDDTIRNQHIAAQWLREQINQLAAGDADRVVA